MYSKNDLIRVLSRNLESEFSVIKFYLSNLTSLDYDINRKKISELVLDSHRHAEMISKALLELSKGKNSTLNKRRTLEALREETGVKEIYRYELEKTEDPAVRTMLKTLIKEETKHEKIVESLK